MKKAKNSRFFLIIGVILMIIIGLIIFQLVVSKINTRQKVYIEGLLNQDEIYLDAEDLQQLKTPIYDITSQAVRKEGYDSYDELSFEDINKDKFFCLSSGIIGEETTPFYVGESRYQVENDKLVFSSDYLLKNITLPNNFDVSEVEAQIIYCWKESNREISISNPDFGIVYWTPIVESGEIIENKVLIFSGEKDQLISTNYFKKIIPLYLSQNKFLIISESVGGGWNDMEVISIDLKNMTFKNEDNCASVFPRNSESLTFDKNCHSGIEGMPSGMVNDYGFERIR